MIKWPAGAEHPVGCAYWTLIRLRKQHAAGGEPEDPSFAKMLSDTLSEAVFLCFCARQKASNILI